MMDRVDLDRMRVDALLTEYQIAQANRDHNETIRWTICSIFIGVSLAVYGFSFTSDLRENFLAVSLLAGFSMVLMTIWAAYSAHVQPYVNFSQDRLWEIEMELQAMVFAPFPKLHLTIKDKTPRPGRGRQITFSLFMTLLTAWLLRVWIINPRDVWFVAVFGVLLLLGCLQIISLLDP
jgi:hypothetical protein